MAVMDTPTVMRTIMGLAVIRMPLRHRQLVLARRAGRPASLASGI